MPRRFFGYLGLPDAGRRADSTPIGALRSPTRESLHAKRLEHVPRRCSWESSQIDSTVFSEFILCFHSFTFVSFVDRITKSQSPWCYLRFGWVFDVRCMTVFQHVLFNTRFTRPVNLTDELLQS